MRVVSIDPLPINLTSTTININFIQRQEAHVSSFPRITNDPEDHDDGQSKHDLEKAFRGIDATPKGPNSYVELVLKVRKIE